MDGAYQVGRYYKVPTVRGTVYYTMANWPVLGPKHEDKEFINFPSRHFHIDWRFVSKQMFDMVKRRHSAPVAITLCEDDRINVTGLPASAHRLLKCKREMPRFPREPFWLHRLEDAYEHCVLKTKVCPHRGLPLDNLTPDADGNVTCPGHALRWNFDTGRMVRETAPAQPAKRETT